MTSAKRSLFLDPVGGLGHKTPEIPFWEDNVFSQLDNLLNYFIGGILLNNCIKRPIYVDFCLSITIFRTYLLSLYQQSIIINAMTRDINRIKVVLAEKKRTNKWLAETLGKDPATVSKWCTNSAQPGLETLLQIAEYLEVNVKELINSSKNDMMYIQVTK